MGAELGILDPASKGRSLSRASEGTLPKTGGPRSLSKADERGSLSGISGRGTLTKEHGTVFVMTKASMLSNYGTIAKSGAKA